METMDRQEIMTKVAAWIEPRWWKEKLDKLGEYERGVPILIKVD
jgi:hypothetical protein